jgi:hypothetical protein
VTGGQGWSCQFTRLIWSVQLWHIGLLMPSDQPSNDERPKYFEMLTPPD